MENLKGGHFYVGELPDGRFVAASSSSPYFCFRAETEEAVIEKARQAVTFFAHVQGLGSSVRIKSVTQTVTSLRPTKKVNFEKLLEAA